MKVRWRRRWLRGGEEAGREVVERLVRIFGRENVYVEVQRHQEREEEWRNQAAIAHCAVTEAAGACDQWRSLCDGI